MAEFAASLLASIWQALAALFWPALVFLGLGLVVKRGALFGDMARAARESGLNVAIMLLNLSLTLPLIGLAAQTVYGWLEARGLTLLDPGDWLALPPLVTVFVAVFVGDFVGYWRHRWEHSRLLWPAHAVHHSDTQMTWLTLERFHPINRLTTFAVDSTVLFLLGLPPFAIIACNLVRHYYGYFIHADLPWTYGRLGRIFVSPAMHRWHHAADPRFYHANFATVFAVFDWAFGTWRVPGPCDSPLGVSDAMGPGLGGQLGYVLRADGYQGLFARRNPLFRLRPREK